jgi:hypothetical protein
LEMKLMPGHDEGSDGRLDEVKTSYHRNGAPIKPR